MLDVHPPHHPAHGLRDFFLHLFTITIGLLIALSLEGMVEWQHHRHLVHQAEAALQAEIQTNMRGMNEALAAVHKDQANLKQDVQVLKAIEANGKPPANGSLQIDYGLHDFASVAWRTAQSTGAVSYMSYEQAKSYSAIYDLQEELNVASQQAARDAVISLAPFINSASGDPDPTHGEAKAIQEKIEVLQGQLMIVESLMRALDEEYKSQARS